MELEKINIECFNVMRKPKIMNEINRRGLFKKLYWTIDSKLVDELNHEYYKYYNIYLFCIRYKEWLLNKEDIVSIINNISLLDYISILRMNMELDDEIVLKIFNKINENKYYLDLGEKPLDYKYHILRRKEISDKTKNIVLDSYSIRKLNNSIKELNALIQLSSIETNIKDLLEDEILSNKYTVYKMLRKKKRDYYE